MLKQLTTKDFIERAILKHGNKYDYSNSVYLGSSNKITIFCPKHELHFDRVASNHLIGHGCPLCAKESFRNKLGATRNYFINRVQEVHGDKYILDESNYTTNNNKVTVRCREHGNFEIRPIDLYRGSGCKECAKIVIGNKNRTTTEDWVVKAKVVHGEKYDYSKSEHTGKTKNICVGCRSCGEDFFPRPSNHLNGTGCPRCVKNGYNKDKPGHIYILSNSSIVKIGITNREPKIRLKEINREKPGFKLVYSQYYTDGAIPLAIEESLLCTKLLCGESINEKFDGYTECFTNVDIEQIIYIATKSGKYLESYNDLRPNISDRNDSSSNS